MRARPLRVHAPDRLQPTHSPGRQPGGPGPPRGHLLKWLRNTAGASPTSVALFHTPLRDGGFGFPELQ
eukprot:8240091-Alexandrium_andersonii.AAC.1